MLVCLTLTELKRPSVSFQYFHSFNLVVVSMILCVQRKSKVLFEVIRVHYTCLLYGGVRVCFSPLKIRSTPAPDFTSKHMVIFSSSLGVGFNVGFS